MSMYRCYFSNSKNLYVYSQSERKISNKTEMKAACVANSTHKIISFNYDESHYCFYINTPMGICAYEMIAWSIIGEPSHIWYKRTLWIFVALLLSWQRDRKEKKMYIIHIYIGKLQWNLAKWTTTSGLRMKKYLIHNYSISLASS